MTDENEIPVKERATAAANNDWNKSVRQLLTDIHDGHERWIETQEDTAKKADTKYDRGADPVRLGLYMQVRAAAMSARVARNSIRLAWASFTVAAVSAAIALTALIWTVCVHGDSEAAEATSDHSVERTRTSRAVSPARWARRHE